MFSLFVGRRLCSLFWAGVILAGLTTVVHGSEAAMVIDAWARPSIGAAGNSAAYMRVMNHGDTAQRIVSIKTGAARRAEIHTHIMDGDIMRMRRVEGGVEIPAHGEVVFKPGGHHVMLFGFSGKLAEGDQFRLTLVFARGGELEVTVKVRKTAPKADGSHDHD